MTYQIRIDDELYESSSKLEEATRLYETVDSTCLRQYHGHEKSLISMEGNVEVVLRKDTVGTMKVRKRGMHF